MKYKFNYLIGRHHYLRADDAGIIRESNLKWTIGKSIHEAVSYFRALEYRVVEIE